MSLLIWKLPVDVINSFVQLITLNVGIITGIAKMLWDVTLLLPYRSNDQIFLTL